MLKSDLEQTDKHSTSYFLRQKNHRFLRRTNHKETRWWSFDKNTNK